MQPEHLLTTVTVHALIWSTGALAVVALRFRSWNWFQVGYALAAVAAIGAAVWLNTVISLGRNSVMFVARSLMDGDLRHLSAAALGTCLGLAAALWPWQVSECLSRRNRRIIRAATVTVVILAFIVLSLMTAQEQLQPLLKRRSLGSIVSNPFGFSQPADFIVEEYHQCNIHPVQIVVGPDDDIYVTGYWGAALQDGVVARLSRTSEGGAIRETTIARNLGRPHGLAFHNGDLYVSRSGQFARAEAGRLVGVNTGAVTLLRDVDGDHLIDYFEDVVAGLPGAQGPDPLHQNNGIAFGPDGALYITVGAHSDRAPTTGPFEGTIVRSRLDGSAPEVFAKGFRNPFDLCFTADGQCFGTDNDASDRRNGDELNLIRSGEHYGFPYADGIRPHPEATVSPLLVTRNRTFQGLCYAASSDLPAQFRDSIYIASYGSGEIQQVQLRREGESIRAVSSVFARVPGALDITVTDKGEFFVACFQSKKIYRLRLRK
ncbi:MAG: PQQ-dependent sugar dehydrogenase [Planctomycetes bacterium]|nr:PQQ-dependent sugar dehydrogenase [Planctomycetota bacterium]